MKHYIKYALCCLVVLMAACKKNEVLFTYNPADPRAGQTIVFSNQTQEGEEWAWTFGDGTTSTSKSPSKTYKQPGTYTVTLKVDDKATRTCTKTITVLDTIPAIGLSDTIVRYYEPIEIAANSYNPFGYTINYHWELPENTLIQSGDTCSKKMTVCFTKPAQKVTIRCTMQVKDQSKTVWNIDTTVYVEDVAARALVLAYPGHIQHQRIYKYGFEDALDYSVNWGSMANQVNSLIALNDYLYLFNTDANGSVIARFEPTQEHVDILIKGTDGNGFEHGTIKDNQLYWTSGDRIYKAPLSGTNRTLSNDMLVADAATLGLSSGQTSGGIAYFNGNYLFAYGDKLYSFANASSTPEVLISGYSIKSFALDAIARKVYFATENGLFVAGTKGQNIELIDAEANGASVAVDNEDNRLFWTTDKGVFYMPLVQADNNKFTTEKAQLNEMSNVNALASDATLRYLK